MEELIKAIADYGILIVIAAVFIWDKVSHAKMTESILRELQTSAKLQAETLVNLKHTCENTTTALSIIQSTLTNQTQSLDRHDKRAEFMNNDIREINALLKARYGGDINHNGSKGGQ